MKILSPDIGLYGNNNIDPMYSETMNLLILDLETTGFSPETEEIAELGVILFNIPHKSIIKQFSTLFPLRTNDAAKINRIPVLPDIQVNLDPYWNMVSESKYLVGHNLVKFDTKFLKKHDLMPDLPVLDTMLDFPWCKGQRKLIDVAVEHGVAVWNPHRALYDCSLIAHIFESYSVTELQSMIDYAAMPKELYISLEPYPGTYSKEAGFIWDKLVTKQWAKYLREPELQGLDFNVRRVS